MKTQIAVVGMGAILPGAMDFSEYWSNILAAKDCIIDIPDSYWDLSEFYDPDPAAKDKTYGYRAGLMGYAPFDSIEFGIPPRVMESISIEQLFALVVAKQALLDANMIGHQAKPFNREKTGVILSSSIGKPAFSLSLRIQTNKIEKIMRNSNVPEHLIERVIERIKESELEWNESSHPGYLPNVVAGRIGNRFDLYGTNCTMDAACAGSLASLKCAVNELESGDCDIVLTGGVMMDTLPFTFISFSKTPAIAPSNISRPFDDEADGMLLGDGVAMMVLKRLEDAERDNDRIYGVIESISSSGDGRAKSIFAPRKEGQTLVLQRAYGDAGIYPNTVGMLEAHGTGTTVGDECEIGALAEYFGGFGCEKKSVLVGSVKSQIGHTRLTAGSASLMKAILSVYHNVLPPTINVNMPNKKLLDSPFYLTQQPKPWIVNSKHPVRRAGVSAFGFGGTNFHVVVREYKNKNDNNKFYRLNESPAGLFFHAAGKEKLIEQCRKAIERFDIDDADYFNELVNKSDEEIPMENARLGIVAGNVAEAKDNLQTALKLLESSKLDQWQKKDIFYRKNGISSDAKVVSLFSGQGSQYINMLSEVATGYPEMRSMFETLDNALLDMDKGGISTKVYPRLFPGESTEENEKILTETGNTQPALAAVCGGLYRILKNRGYMDEYLIGHSFGEITALWAAGALDDKTYAQLAAARGDVMASCVPDGTSMLAVFRDKDSVHSLIDGFDRLYIANENSPGQTIVSGDMKQIAKLETELDKKGITSKRVKVSCAFHSPYMAKASEQFARTIEESKFENLKKGVYSNSTAKLYPQTGGIAKRVLVKQITNPVLFKTSVENAYKNGARIFVEIGPGRVLASLTEQILEGKEYHAIAVNPDKTGDSHRQLERFFTQLKVLGLSITKDPYFSPLKSKKNNPDNKTTYMLPPLHFVMEDTARKMQNAEEAIDPLPESPMESAPNENFSETVKTETSTPTKRADNGPAHNYERQKEKELIQYKTGETADKTEFNEDRGVMMEKGELKNFYKPVMQYAYDLQSLNGDMFKQFTQSQEMQMDKFKDILQIDNIASKDNMDGLLHFIEMFQSNSMKAYETYFTEQSKLLTGTSGNIPGPMSYEGTDSNTGLITRSEQDLEYEQDNISGREPISGQEFKHDKNAAEQVSISVQESGYRQDSESGQSFSETVLPENGTIDTDKKQGSSIFSVGTAAEKIEERIIEVISDRTGYPVEMIDPDMNIESDLGIDSIRRVEIFSILNDEMEKGFTEEDIKVMSTFNSIEEFAQFLEKKINKDNTVGDAVVIDSKAISGFIEQDEPVEDKIVHFPKEYVADETDEFEDSVPISDKGIKRYNVCRQEVDLPLIGNPVIAGEGLVLLTWDEAGLSAEIGEKLKSRGYHVVYVSFPWQKKDPGQTYRLKEISDESIESIYYAIKDAQDIPLTGFIHVAGLRQTKQDIYDIFDHNETETLKAVFLFAKYFGQNAQKPKQGKNFFIALARMDGYMGMGGQWSGAAMQGGLFGMVKSLHREWEAVYCKAIDISSGCDNTSAADLAMEEIFDPQEKFVEIARDAEGKRFTNTIFERYDDTFATELPGPDDVFLVTGGGRGITARCVLQFAKEYKSKFIILGRSSISHDLSWTKGETDSDKLRPLMFNHLKEIGQVVKPVEIDGMIHDALNQFEILNNIKQIEQAGGKAVYIACDIRDEWSVSRAISEGAIEMGNITGFIHGAGMIADKSIDRKTEQDFQKVFETKVTGLELCLKYINPDNLKYIVMFSSISSYFGNQGQVDYAMANEVLNKFTYDFKNFYPNAFALSINWGPWEGGMVSEGLKQVLTAKGEIMITYDNGAEYFSEQFRYSFKPEDCQMLISGTDKYISHDVDFNMINWTDRFDN